MPPPPASPAIQQRGPGPPGPLLAAWAPRCWMAGLAWRLAGGGISITPDESHLMYHTWITPDVPYMKHDFSQIRFFPNSVFPRFDFFQDRFFPTSILWTFFEMSGRHVGYVRDICWQIFWHFRDICCPCLEFVLIMSGTCPGYVSDRFVQLVKKVRK